MKILYVDLLYDYGVKARGFNQIGQMGFLNVFKTLGHEVVPFYYDDYLNNLNSLQGDLLKFSDEQLPDLIYFCLYTDQFFPETLNKLKNKYKTISWFGDDQWRFDNFTSKYAQYFTYCVTTDPFAIPKYKKIGIENVILSQWAALNIDIPDEKKSLAYKYDVSFVGGSHSVRRWFVDEFRKAGVNVHTFGYRWPNGPVSLDSMIDIFRTSKINLNLSNSINFDIRYLTNNLKNIIVALKSAKNVSQMKARSFEIPYYGGFQLTEYLPTLENYFDIGKEIVCYTNVDEAIKLAKFYLENDVLRENIKTASINRARKMHTYVHRHQEVFSSL